MKKISVLVQSRRWSTGQRRWRRHLVRKTRTYRPAGRIRIQPPEILSFRENFQQTITFLTQLRDATLKPSPKRNSVFVDLEPVKRLSVPVAIVLAAEFHRWSLTQRTRLSPKNSRGWAPEVRSLLSNLGVFDLLKTRPVETDARIYDNLTLTPLESGEKTDGAKINELQTHFAQSLAGFTTRPTVFEGLMEAAENAISHAYPNEYVPLHPYAGHRWWGASFLDLQRMRLRFFIFDQGAGIPSTLPTGPLREWILSFLAETSAGVFSNDAQMLRAAFEVGRTRTGMANRGLGLQRMADVVRGSKTGFLRIISGRAEIVHNSDDHIESRSLPTHIGGTLIEWNMPADVFVTAPDEDGHAEAH